jgi:hypothetical protein
MQGSDREAFGMALMAASEIYRQDITPQAVRLWWDALNEYPLPAVQAAMQHHIKASRFMPTPADLVAVIAGSPQDKAADAWQKVLEAARVHGQSRSIAWDDPLIPACVLGMGGFARICMCNINDLQWLRKEFMPLYQTFAIRPPDRLPRYLPGHHETSNRSAGYDTPDKVYLVGDQEQASLLLTQQELSGMDTHRLQAISSKAISALSTHEDEAD